jgi:hypothetical protein
VKGERWTANGPAVVRQPPMRVKIRTKQRMARTHDPSAEGSRIGYVPSLRPRTGTIARQAQTRGLPRLPLRVERPKDVFNRNVLNVRLVQGVASYLTSYQQTVCLRRHPIDLKKRNATPLRSGWWLRVT